MRILLVTALVLGGLAAAPGAARAWRALREVDDINSMAVRPDGTILYVRVSGGGDSVSRLAPNGRRSLFAGATFPAGGLGDGGRAVKAELDQPEGLAVASDGAVLIADSWHPT
jgi:hypothetical protein